MVRVTPLYYKKMKRFLSKPLPCAPLSQDPKEDLFELINPSRLNEYLKIHMADLTAKVFKFYNSSSIMQDQLEKSRVAKENLADDTLEQAKVKILQ